MLFLNDIDNNGAVTNTDRNRIKTQKKVLKRTHFIATKHVVCKFSIITECLPHAVIVVSYLPTEEAIRRATMVGHLASISNTQLCFMH